jgi:glutathione peroxidase-family protein
MKKILVGSAVFFLFSFTNWTGVFDLYITSIDGSEQPLSVYQGKKMMMVILPVSRTAKDSSMLAMLDSLNDKYKDSVTMVGIPSYEDGFDDDSMYSLLPWYHSYLDSNFVISGGMSTRKNSIYQAPLFSYLTAADQNGHFDDDVYGPGEKFFIDKEGTLTGISLPDATFNEEVFKEMIAKK